MPFGIEYPYGNLLHLQSAQHPPHVVPHDGVFSHGYRCRVGRKPAHACTCAASDCCTFCSGDECVQLLVLRYGRNLSITAGLPMPKVYVVNDPAPNAFATGRNAEHSAVCATTGLLTILNQTELEGVIAHELSHIGNRDMLVSTVAVVLAGFLSMLADLFLRMSSFGGGRDDRDNRLGGVLFVLAIVGVLLAPIAAQMIQLAISRKREFLADASGAQLTRYPDGLASALMKISLNAQPMISANHATAHLFIANPFGKQGGIWQKLSGLFATHPPVAERIKALHDMDMNPS
jgi:heat shock protein HtpX